MGHAAMLLGFALCVGIAIGMAIMILVDIHKGR